MHARLENALPQAKVIPSTPLPERALEVMEKAVGNLARLQEARGSWAGDYGGPMFLLPMYVALAYAAKQPPDAYRARRMSEYFFNVQRPDGSIGLHAEASAGSMFCTALSYVALRLLGNDAQGAPLSRMRAWIHANGTPLGAASWGKFTLCLLGLYDWEGLHPLPPELWLLPQSAPMHPSRLWCHCRQVYLPMAWLYGTRSTVRDDALLSSLREELYAGRYHAIDWKAHRDTVSPVDDFRPSSVALKTTNRATGLAESAVVRALRPLRTRALDECLKHIRYEDDVTDGLDIGPVNKVLNGFVHLFRDPAGPEFKRSFARCDAYLWDGHDGMKFQGYNNSELWDTAFAVQALLATPLSERAAPVLQKAYGFLRDNRILEDPPRAAEHYRHPSKGGWPFSNRPHGWPITDCTSEALKCALALEGRFADEVPLDFLRDSVRLLLSWQNDDGGWATYEKKRGGDWLEALNPSQVFGEIMVDYSYVECTSACVQALLKARRRFPGEFGEELPRAVERGVAFLRAQQRPDGSYEGSWAVCFTYGTWFAVSGLVAAGVPPTDPAIAGAVRYLLGKQRPDGGWGEHGDTCRARRWMEAERGQVAQSSWALLALLRGGCTDAAALDRAAAFLCGRQEPDGSWAREPLVGVFNKTCLINYDNYRHYFPLWALGEWFARGAAAGPRAPSS